MSVHGREDLERYSRFTRRKFSHALMSDAKWRKLFDAVRESSWLPSLVTVKFVDADAAERRPMGWPREWSFWGPPQWVDTPEFGPVELRSIEWLTIPATVMARGGAPSVLPQKLSEIRTALARVGQFPLEDTPEGLRIVGYK